MKTTIVISFIFIFNIVWSDGIISQENKCKVLKKEISESYKGACKKGLAHGIGNAKGVDSYSGEFRKGFPDGSGNYTWSDGAEYNGQWKRGLRNGYGKFSYKLAGRDTVVVGYWKMGKYIGKSKNEKGYKVDWKTNIKGYSIQRIGDGDKIEIKILRTGAMYNTDDLLLTYNHGVKRVYGNNIFIEEIKFPFEGSLKFSMMNELNTQKLNCTFKYAISKSGSWVITIRN